MGQLDKINKVLDIEKMQKVQDDFSELTGLAAV